MNAGTGQSSLTGVLLFRFDCKRIFLISNKFFPAGIFNLKIIVHSISLDSKNYYLSGLKYYH